MTSTPHVHVRFEEHARARPDAVALTLDGEHLSYGELDRRADEVAGFLRARGAVPGTLVGLCLERSFELIVGIIGILKSGAAYVPFEPNHPEQRLAGMLAESRVPHILTQRTLLDRFAPDHPCEIHTIEGLGPSDGAAGARPGDEDLAYVLYTSGTTGTPKGVQITHRNVARLFSATEHWFHFGADDVWTMFHSYAFDASVWELWGALAHGGRLVIVPRETARLVERFHDLVVREGVTTMIQTPTAFRQFVRADGVAPRSGGLRLRRVVLGGEALDVPGLRPWFERHGDRTPRLINMYGITETTVHVTYRELRLDDTTRPASVIGQPIPDLRLHVLDGDLRPVRAGEVGEMYVGGAGVSRGYLGQPGLTNERFVADPFLDGAVLYRSGDLAMPLPDGDLAYAGRADAQVQIRGFRVELGEIETAIAAHEGVAEVAVAVRDENTPAPKVVAYVVPSHGHAPTLKEVRRFLADRLPEYMFPNRIRPIDKLPLTDNTKIDRRALPWP